MDGSDVAGVFFFLLFVFSPGDPGGRVGGEGHVQTVPSGFGRDVQ